MKKLSPPAPAVYAAGNVSHVDTTVGVCDSHTNISCSVACREYAYVSDRQVAHTDLHAPRLGLMHLSGQGLSRQPQSLQRLAIQNQNQCLREQGRFTPTGATDATAPTTIPGGST